MALEDVVLLHPASRGLYRDTLRINNRATSVPDAAQAAALFTMYAEVEAARAAGQTLQPYEMASDPAGHLGTQLKWQAKDLLYRALDNPDINTDLANIAAEVIGVADYSGTIIIREIVPGVIYGSQSQSDFSPTLTGFPLMPGSSWQQLFINNSSTVGLQTDGDESVYPTVYIVFPNLNSNLYILLFEFVLWQGTTSAAVFSYLQSQVGIATPFEIFLP